MTTLPKFDGFSISVTEDDVLKSKERVAPLEPGDHELEILSVVHKAPVQADPTWHRYQVILGRPGTEASAEGKFKGAVYHSVMIPTADLKYNGKLGVFNMLADFFAGLGENLTPSTTPDLLPEYFVNNGKKLEKRLLKVKLGYKKPYISFNSGKYQLVDEKGTPLNLSVPNEFANRASAEGQAIADRIELQGFIEVMRVYPGDKPAAKAKKTKASAEW